MVRPSDARPAELDEFVRGWTDRALDRTPLTDADRVAVTDAIRRCYADAGLPWPGRVFWAPSPLAGRLLAADLARRYTPVTTRIRAKAPTMGGALVYGCAVGLYGAVLAGLLWLWLALPLELGEAMPAYWHELWIGAVVAGLLPVPVLVWQLAVEDSADVVDDLVFGLGRAMAMLFFAGVWLAVVVGQIAASRMGAFVGWSGLPPQAWVATLLTVTLGPAVAVAMVIGIVVKWRADPPAMRCADPAHDRLDRCLTVALTAASTAAPVVPGAHGQVRSAVDGLTAGIDRSVELAVQEATRSGRRWPRRYPVGHFGGQYGGRLAAATWLAARGAPVPADAAVFVRDFAAASRAGWWWPHTRFVVVGGRASALHLERVGAGAGIQRLHRTDGPAAEWPDGYRVYAVHGTGIPADLVGDGWDVEEIHRHPNSEVRRAAIELIGWAEYIRRAGWRLVATAPDPGNPPHELALYEDPSRRLRDVRVLVMTNGSPDRSGALRRHAETVPDAIDDPVAAAAWQYDCPVEVYRKMRRRT